MRKQVLVMFSVFFLFSHIVCAVNDITVSMGGGVRMGTNETILVGDIYVWSAGFEDIYAPVIQLISPVSGATYYLIDLLSVNLSFSVVDEQNNLDTCKFYLMSDGNVHTTNTSIACDANTSFVISGAASYTLFFYADDSAGNENSSSVNFTGLLGVPTGGVTGGGGGAAPVVYSGVVGSVQIYNFSVGGGIINFSLSFFDTNQNLIRAPEYNASFSPSANFTYLATEETELGRYVLSFLIGNDVVAGLPYSFSIESGAVVGSKSFSVGGGLAFVKERFGRKDGVALFLISIGVGLLNFLTPLGKKEEEELF